MIDAPLPALVLGSGLTPLAVVRTLGQQGVPVCASVARRDFVSASRWLPRVGHLPSTDSLVSLGEYLERLPLDGGVLIPCSDDLALQAAELPPSLTERFRTFQPDATVLRLLVDKGAFLQALRVNDIPHPDTHIVERPEDLDALSDDALEAAFVKPRDSQRFQRAYGVKAFRPSAREDLRALLDRLLREGHGLMIQKYVPGPAANHYFLDGFAQNGEIVALFARQRLRMYPLDFGNSTFMVSIALDEVQPAVHSLTRLLRALRYRGIFSAEFKRDAHDREFRIIEVNARAWWYLEFAAQAGVDVARLAYRAALGLPLTPPTSYQVGRKFMYPYYDYFACRALIPGRVAALGRFLRDAVGANQPIFAWNDPLPALRHWGRALPGIVARRLPGRREARPR